MLSVRHLVVFFLLGITLVISGGLKQRLQKDFSYLMTNVKPGKMDGISGPQCWSGSRVRYTAGEEIVVNLHRVQCHSQLCVKTYDEKTFTDRYDCVQEKLPRGLPFGLDMMETSDTIIAKKVGSKCFTDDVFGFVKKCYCDEELCNSSRTSVSSVFLLFVSWAFL